MSAAAILDRRRDHESRVRPAVLPTSPARAVPILPVRADGMTIYGADGRAYLDCLSGADTLLGHNHPVAIEAIRRAIDGRALLDAGCGQAAAIEDEFAATLLGILPSGLANDARIHVCSSSSTAAEHVRGRIGCPQLADESLTGLGRTGELWGADYADIALDALLLPKSVGGGLPLTAIAYRTDLEPWFQGTHCDIERRDVAPSHLLAMAAGTATIKYILEHDLAARARTVGERMRAAFECATRDLPVLTAVHGRGLMLDVEVVHPDGTPVAASELAHAVHAAAMERGLLVELGGPHDAQLRLLPPLTITDQEADRVVELLLDALAAVSSAVTTLTTAQTDHRIRRG